VLIATKCAYVSLNGDVYYDVTKNCTYGKLSSQDISSLYYGIRIVADIKKRSYSDFVLWKLCSSGMLRWDSKWGPGRPGWHIECSAMVVYFFGDCVDYHGGGVDLIFTHHENECAQVESIFRKNYADVWLHVGLILFDKQKMSKSYCNFIKVYNLLTIVGGDVVRYYLLRSHYKQPLEYNLDTMYNCEIFVKKIKSTYTFFDFNGCKFTVDYVKIFKTVFFTHLMVNMDADFNTPKSVTIIQQLLYVISNNKQNGLYKECLFLTSWA
jgi:cysteinyl-tRNA synthetase